MCARFCGSYMTGKDIVTLQGISMKLEIEKGLKEMERERYDR